MSEPSSSQCGSHGGGSFSSYEWEGGDIDVEGRQPPTPQVTAVLQTRTLHYLTDAPTREPFESGSMSRVTMSYPRACLGALMEAQITEVVNVLNITPDEAVILLYKCGWSTEKAMELWTTDVNTARQTLGLSPGGDPPRTLLDARVAKTFLVDEVFLGDDFSPLLAEGTACGHLFSRSAWAARFRHVLAQEPLKALAQRCLKAPACCEAVRPRLWRECLEANEWTTYVGEMLRSFSSSSRYVRACPQPLCDLVVEVRSDAATLKNVTCGAGHTFCFDCSETPHEPASCKNALKWSERDKSEGLGTAWIVANTKACPKCDQRIEKNQGCNHMRCLATSKKGGAQCQHEFCWQCLKPWSEHIAPGGRGYQCNVRPDELLYNPDDAKAAEQELKLYMFYW